ncbi:glycoside hydrolase family 2 TIM barrel-domain containing protein [Limosilactobacillus agrestimuris]|uniref:glycoside hydrolase family 2 TIM barrel-domain containing protein n=1 Tax=Limosilactobacillus agrestimuris TaxID=2941331 RepID=UPI0030BA27C6
MGIWQNVWLEETGNLYLEQVRMLPHIHQAQLEIDAKLNAPATATLQAAISFQEHPITTATCTTINGRAHFAVDISNDDPNFRLHYWSPDEPNLYDVTFKVIEDHSVTDTVYSYFGMRQIETRNYSVYLNDQGLYQKLILNQGYYPNAGLTGSVEDYKSDLTRLKAMGFNGNRIHQHVESHRMLYLCDQLGVLAWAEFPSSFSFSPTMMKHMLNELPAFIAKHFNHPSVIAYVLMNESWGVNEIAHNREEQAFADSLYYLTKGFDSSRLVIANDGWEQVKTDLCTIHDYNGDLQSLLASYQDQSRIFTGSPSLTSGRRVFCDHYEHQDMPFMISEYGGIAYEENAQQESWGYGKRMESKKAVIDKIRQLTNAVMSIPDCVGFCYTQLSDVEQEVNGLLDHDHQYKFDPEVIRKIMTATHQNGFDFN